jgi:hypothetical protein
MLIMSQISFFFNVIIIVLRYLFFEIRKFVVIIIIGGSSSISINFILSFTAFYQDIFRHNQ